MLVSLPLLAVLAPANIACGPFSFVTLASSLLPGVSSETRGILDTWRSVFRSCSFFATAAAAAASWRRCCRLKGRYGSIEENELDGGVVAGVDDDWEGESLVELGVEGLRIVEVGCLWSILEESHVLVGDDGGSEEGCPLLL